VTGTPHDDCLAESERSGRRRCELGIDRHLAEFVLAPLDLRIEAAHACA
jgi:hypothetical protein